MMSKARKSNISLFLLTLLFCFTGTVAAQTKVVVIPLGSDEKSSPISNVVTVAKAGGDFTDPIAAMNSITDASISNPYTVIIAPGVYELGAQLLMKEYVTVTGLGIDATILTGSIGGEAPLSDAALVIGASNSQISDLTIENKDSTAAVSTVLFLDGVVMTIDNCKFILSGANSSYGIHSESNSQVNVRDSAVEISGGSFSLGILARNSSTFWIGNTKVSVSGSSGTQIGIVSALSSRAEVSDSSIQVQSGGGFQSGVTTDPLGQSILDHVRIEVSDGPGADYGVFNDQDAFFTRISGSYIQGPTSSVGGSSSASSTQAYISNTILDGGSVTSSSACSFVFTEAGVALDASCAIPPP